MATRAATARILHAADEEDVAPPLIPVGSGVFVSKSLDTERPEQLEKLEELRRSRTPVKTQVPPNPK